MPNSDLDYDKWVARRQAQQREERKFTAQFQVIDHPPSLMGFVYWHLYWDGVKVNGGISPNMDEAKRDAVIYKFRRYKC
jgi:hypothetical protein